MPDVLIFVPRKLEEQVQEMMSKLGLALREATAIALKDVQPHQVAVMAISFFASDNATSMQILGIASASPTRLEKLETWRDELAKAWVAFSKDKGIPWKADVDAWSTMPAGKW